MNRPKLISFIGRQVKGNWVSIILILTSSSINFKWLIRPKSPGASNLLVWSLSSSQVWGFLAARCAWKVPKFRLTYIYSLRKYTFEFVLDANSKSAFFKDLFTMFNCSCFEMFCSELITDQAPSVTFGGGQTPEGPGRVIGLQGRTFTHWFLRPFLGQFLDILFSISIFVPKHQFYSCPFLSKH